MNTPLLPRSPSPTLFEAIEGEARKTHGIIIVNAAESPLWTESANKAVRFLAATRREFTADDVREYAGDPVHPNAMGARLHVHAQAGLIRKVGYRESDRAERHRAIVAVWVGA